MKKIIRTLLRESLENNEELKILKLKRLNLYNQALKTFPNSPKQLKIKAEIELVNNKIKEIENGGLTENLLTKSFLPALLMTMGVSWGQIKPEYKAKIDSIQKIQTLTPQQKRLEIQKIVQLNRDEINAKKREDFLRNMAAAGFRDEEEYKKYLAKNAKKKNVGLDGMQTADANKRGDDKGSCSTGQTNKGDSLKDNK